MLASVWEEKDFEAALAMLHPEIEWDWSNSRAPYAGVSRGRDEVRAMWLELSSVYADWSIRDREVTEVAPGLVVVAQTVETQGLTSGIKTTARGATLSTVRDGLVVSVKLFQSETEALEAARVRLSPS